MYLLRTTQKTVFVSSIIASLAIGFVIGNVWSPLEPHPITNGTETHIATPADLNFSLLDDAWTKLKNNFYFKDKINNQEAIYGAAYGLVESLKDPYTVFFTPDQAAQFRDSLDGALEGIGAELGLFDGTLTVTGVIKDSPAFKSGIKAKDVILKIDDTNTTNMSLGDAVSKIRGHSGTDVTLSILHEGQKTSNKVVVTRAVIDTKQIDYEMLDNSIAYIRISQFADDTKQELNRIGTELTEKKPKGIILDLRWNPGGFLDSAVDVISFFQKKGVAVKKVVRTDQNTINVTGETVFPETPLLVLVNGSSASASEIVAGALRDNHRAKLIGEKTFGKGTMQEMHSLPNGASIKITIGKWFPPSGEDIDHKGIAPDIEVKLDQDTLEKGKDNQKDKAVEEMEKELKA